MGPGLWRLPTQKELMAAYEHGIHDLGSDHTAVHNLGAIHPSFLSSSTESDQPTEVYFIWFDDGLMATAGKGQARHVLCVSP